MESMAGKHIALPSVGILTTITSRIRNEFSFMTGNYVLIVLTGVLTNFANEIPNTYYPLYVVALGGNPSVLGVIGFVSFLSLAAVQFPGGYLADKYGRRRLIPALTFVVGLSYLFYVFALSWHFILVGAFIGSVCLIYQPGLQALMADSLPPQKRGRGYSMITFFSHVSTAPSPLIAGLLYVAYGLVGGMRFAYAILVGAIAAAALLRVRLRETIIKSETIGPRQIAGSYGTVLVENLEAWRKVSPSMRFLLVANLLRTFGWAPVDLFLVLYAVQDLNVSEGQWPLVVTVLLVTLIIVAYPCGKIVDSWGGKRSLLLACSILVPALLFLIHADFLRLLILLPIIGSMRILVTSASQSLQADIVPREYRGKIYGSSNFATNVGIAVGQLGGGFFYQTLSHKLPFYVLIFLTILQITIVFFLVHEPRHREF